MAQPPSTGGQAFPIATSGMVYRDGSNEPPQIIDGMTVRTWLAGMAVAGIVHGQHEILVQYESVAEEAVSIADAVIKRLGL